MKPYVLISGLALRDNNRGTAALGYGAVSFMYERGLLLDNQTIVNVRELGAKVFFKWVISHILGRDKSIIKVNNRKWIYKTCAFLPVEKRLVACNWFPLKKYLLSQRYASKISLVAAINGGDGFSDIYGEKIFRQRLIGINFAMEHKIPLILLPQTVGPFNNRECLVMAETILKYACKVYVRDECFIKELEGMGAEFELTNDLSYYMKPEPWDICVDSEKAVGVNVSGLAWDNKFETLAGQFANYPLLMTGIVKMFQKKGKKVYLISHSYNYQHPELHNDDLKAARELYDGLDDKSNVVLIDKDLISPQVKYLISRMSFFIGTRMHANFAAIFTHVPLFGLSYSYKFKGAFENNGIFNRTANINNVKIVQVENILKNIESAYQEDVEAKYN